MCFTDFVFFTSGFEKVGCSMHIYIYTYLANDG